MQSQLCLVGALLVSLAPLTAQGAKPTVTVVIPGWSPGDGRQIWPEALREIGGQAGGTLAGGGAMHKTIYYQWPSHGNNHQAVADLARQIKAEAAEMGSEVDLQIIGHSRGGIVACDVLEEIASDPQFGHVQGVLLDPTAATTAGDQFPTRKPAGVDRLVNYYDGKNGILIGGTLPSDYPGWRNTRSDRDIAGAENYEVDLGGGDTHVSIVGSYRDDQLPVTDPATGAPSLAGAGRDTRNFYYDKEGQSRQNSNPHQPGGSNQNVTLQAPRSDQERLTGPLEKGLNDVFEQGAKAGSDSAREWHNVLEGKSGSKDPKVTGKHWSDMAEQGLTHGRDLAVGGAEQLGRNVANGGKHVQGLAERGGRRLEETTRQFARDPAGTTEKGLAHTGRELERLGNHYVGGAADLAEHELNMAASGAQHAGRMLTKQGKKAGNSLAEAGEGFSEALQNPLIFDENQREFVRPLGDTVREGTKFAGDGIRETSRLGGDVLREGGQAAKDATRETGRAVRDLSESVNRAAKDSLSAGGKAVGDTGREIRRAADGAGQRVRVFAGDAARESRRAGGDIAREAKALPDNLLHAAQHPERTMAAGRDSSRRVMADAERRAGQLLSRARDKAASDAGAAAERTGQKLTRTRERVVADAGRTAERAGKGLTRTRERVQAQGSALEQRTGETLTRARDRALDHLAGAEQNVGHTASRTRDRVATAVQSGAESARQRASEAWNDARRQGGTAWNDFREQLPRPNLGNKNIPVRPNPLTDLSRKLTEAMQRDQARQQAQRAQELARQEAQRAQERARQQAIAAQQAAQRQAAALRRQAEERARQAAVARDNLRRQAEQARQRAAEQARRAEAQARATAQRAANDVNRELGNAGGAISGGFKRITGGW